MARDLGWAVTGRGGGLGPSCAADGAVMVDLSAHFAGGVALGTDAQMGGGATLGTALDTLAPLSRRIPAGVVPFAGMGLALQGGVGYWTRSLGLTLDHIRAVELVVPSGDAPETMSRSPLTWTSQSSLMRPFIQAIGSVTFMSPRSL